VPADSLKLYFAIPDAQKYAHLLGVSTYTIVRRKKIRDKRIGNRHKLTLMRVFWPLSAERARIFND
jgi:hypothetical protein